MVIDIVTFNIAQGGNRNLTIKRRASTTTKKIIFVVFSACHFLFLYFPIFKDLTMNKGAVIKYGTEGGGRDLTGSPKLLDGKYWANKLLQVINMGHEAVLLRICFHYFTNVLNIVSVTFSVLLIIDVVLYLSV